MTDNIFQAGNDTTALLGQIAGQIKSSLGNIQSALNRIAPVEDRESDGRLDRDAAVLLKSYYQIMRLANNLEEASTLDDPPFLRLENRDVVAFCREIVDKAAFCAQMMEVELTFTSEREKHVVQMDPDALERLVLNLLSNALKFTPAKGTVAVELHFGRQVELHVVDTGRGIPPEKMDTVFSRYRVGGRMEPPPYGLGLGLTICRKIAADHGGALLLNSRKDGGTRVVLSLPDKQMEDPAGCKTIRMDYTGGHNRALVELADVMPVDGFGYAYLD